MTLEELNNLDENKVRIELAKCCGSQKWVNEIMILRPFNSLGTLFTLAGKAWNTSTESDWLEAFSQHPKIGDIESLKKRYGNTKEWASDEQKAVSSAASETIVSLAEMNRQYEQKFGFIFIVFATGKTAEEILEILMSRLENDYNVEIRIARDEQLKITINRLEKLLS